MDDSSNRLDGRTRAEQAAFKALALSNCGGWHSYHSPDCGRCSLASAAQIAIAAALEEGGVIRIERLHYWVERVQSVEIENDRLRDQLEEAHLARIEAQNPGIDINQVREERRKEADAEPEHLCDRCGHRRDVHDGPCQAESGCACPGVPRRDGQESARAALSADADADTEPAVSECCRTNAPTPGGRHQEGERWTCPDCARGWVHVIEESEGCWWEPEPSRAERGEIPYPEDYAL